MEELNITEPQADVQAEVQVEQTPTEDNVTSYFNSVIKPSGDFTTESEFREFLSDKGQAESYFKEVVGPAGDFGSFEEFSSFLNVGGVGKTQPYLGKTQVGQKEGSLKQDGLGLGLEKLQKVTGRTILPSDLTGSQLKQLSKQFNIPSFVSYSDQQYDELAKKLRGKSFYQAQIETAKTLPNRVEARKMTRSAYKGIKNELAADQQLLEDDINQVQQNIGQFEQQLTGLKSVFEDVNQPQQIREAAANDFNEIQKQANDLISQSQPKIDAYNENQKTLASLGRLTEPKEVRKQINNGLDAWLAVNPYSPLNNPVVKGVSNAIVPSFLNTAAAIIDNPIMRMGYTDSGKLTADVLSNTLFEAAKGATITTTAEEEKSVFDELTPENVQYTIGNLLGYIIPSATGAGIVSKAAAPITSQLITGGQVYGNYYKEGLDAGLSKNEAALFASVPTIVTAYLGDKGVEMMLAGLSKQSIKSVIREAAKSSIGKSPSEIMKIAGNASKGFLEGVLKEGSQEGVEQLSEMVSKDVANNFADAKFEGDFTIDGYLRGVAEASTLGAVVGGPLGGIAGLSSSRNIADVAAESLVNPNEELTFRKTLQSLLQDGEIGQDQYDNVNAQFEIAKLAAQKIPNQVTDSELRTEATELIQEKEALNAEIETKDPAMTTSLKNRVAEIDKRLGEISEGKAVAVEEEQTAPEEGLTVEEIKRGFQEQLDNIDLASPKAGQITSDIILDYIVAGNADSVEAAIDSGKPVDGKEASMLLDSLYTALARVDESVSMTAEQKADLQGILEPLISKIEGYDNITEGTTIKVAERQATARPVEDARKVKDQASAIENSRGKKGVLIRPSRRNPNQRVKENVRSIDPATIPIESEVSIVRDDAGEIVGYSFTLPDGNELFVDDPGGGIDLALMQKNEIMGAPPQLMEQVFEDVMREVEVAATTTKTETTKPTEDAVQEQAAGQVPVQPEAGVSETMAEGKPEAESQVTPTEGQTEQAQATTEEKKEVNVSDALNIVNALNQQTPGQTNEAPRTYTTKNIDRAINDARKAKDAKLEKALVDAKAIMKALGKKDTKVVIHFNQGSYTQSVVQAGGEAQASGTSGFVISKDGNTIHLNLPKIKSNEVVLHEGAHPVLDWITKNNPERIDALYTELEALAQVLPAVNNAIAFSKKYGNTAQAKKEAIVQFMALVADGTINLSQANPTFKQKAIEFIKKLLQAMGIDFGVKISDDASVTELAKRFTESVKYGREISVASKTGFGTPQMMIAGVNAELAQDVRDNLQVARDMEAANKDAKTIRIATGWEKGVDGLWRYEVPDNIPYLKDTVRQVKQFLFEEEGTENISQKASYFLPPELIKLYPGLDEVFIVFNKRGDENEGSYSDLTKIINVNLGVYPEKTVSVLLHEIQHAIQDIEGFDKGASAKDLLDTFILKEQALLDRIKKLEGPRGGNNPTAIENAKQDYRDFVKKFGTTKDGKKILSALDLYNRKAGEVEARNVQARMGMTPEQRRSTTLQETEDVARDSQIFLREGDMATGPQFSMAGYNDLINGFYSPLERTIEGVKQDKLPVKQWLEKFARGEEAKWTGLQDWLSQQEGSVTKQRILRFLNENRITVEEVVKELRDTKYYSYQLEGENENYKEVLVTLPKNKGEISRYKELAYEARDVGDFDRETYFEDKIKELQKDDYKSGHFNEPNILVHLRINTRIDADGNKVLFLEEVQSDWGQQGKKEGFESPERKATDKKIAELWDKQKEAESNVTKLMRKAREEKPMTSIAEQISLGNKEVEQAHNLVNEIQKQRMTLVDSIRSMDGGVINPLPSAPFVMDTNAWVKLGLKVALKEAVAQGANKIAWTTGEQQNERYDLSKQVDSIDVSKDDTGMYKILAKKNGKTTATKFAEKPQEIEAFIGKDMADKIVSANIPNGGAKVFSGVDLKIGGKGMKGFYGSIQEGSKGIVGGVAEKLFGQNIGETKIDKSKFGGAKQKKWIINIEGDIYEKQFDSKKEAQDFTETSEFQKDALGYEYVIKENPNIDLSTQPSIDVTPELQAQVQKGLPQFSKAGGVPISDVITALRNAGATEQVIADALKQSGYYTQEEINDAMGLPAPQPTPMIQPPVIPPSFGVEPENGTDQRVNSIYERMALKAESEGNLELAAEIRRRGLYNQRSKEQVDIDSNLLISAFNDDIEAAADFVMNNPINGDIRTNVLGKRMTRAKEAALSNRTVENLATLEQAIYDFAAYSTDLGQAVNEIKNVEANNPELFYLGRFSEYIATLADSLGNPAVTTTNASKIVKAAKDVVKLRKDILNQVANVISEMADDATIDSLMIDALKLDKAGKDRVLTKRMRDGLRKITGSVESKKIIGEKLKKLAELGVFGLEETRDEVKELILKGLAEINPTLQTPLDTEEIQEMAEMFMIIYEEMATQKMDALLDKAFNGNNKNNAAVTKAVMYGALDTPNALNKFAQKFGLSYITPQMQQQLKNAAQQVANAKGNTARSIAQAAFTSMFNNFIYQTKPVGYKIIASSKSFFKYYASVFYNTALGAINTIFRAFQGNTLRTLGNVLYALTRGEFNIVKDSLKDVYFRRSVPFKYTDRNGVTRTIDAKTQLVFDDIYSSLRGLPRLAEVKREGGLNQIEIDIRNTDSRLKRRLLRTFAVPASRLMGAVDASVMPLNMFLTKRQAFYEVLKAFYKDKGITISKKTIPGVSISEADLRIQLNSILGVDTDYVSKAMEQAVVDVVGSKLWTDLGFTNADEFPTVDPRYGPLKLRLPKASRESKIYNEFLFRTREILDSEENKRLQDSFSKTGYGSTITQTETDLMSAAIDNYAMKVSSELAFLGTPRGSMRAPAEFINGLSTKYPFLKYIGLSPLFTNAAFNSVSMAIRVAPGFNIIQYLKYWYTGTRGGQKGSQKEFGADYEQLTKIDQNKMLKTVLLTNTLFLVASALKPYDDKEEEKKAIDDKTWTGSTPLKITKAQTDLGYLPGRIYIKGEAYDYRDNPLALLISGISFVRNYGLWSFDNKSNNFYVEDDAEIGYDPTFIEQASAYAQYIITSMLEFSTIKDMSKTYSDIIEMLSPPKGEDDIRQGELVTRFIEKKGANIIRTSIPYTRFVAEMKTITDAIMDEEKKLPITFYDNIVFGHAIEDNVIKTNGYDFFGRPVKDAFTLVLPFISSVSINQDPKVDREHSLYRKMNYTPRLLLNDRLPVHITLDDLNGDANKFEDFFKTVKLEEKKGDGLVAEVERKSKTEQRVLVSLFMSKEEANLVNQKACEFAGKFVEENFADLQSMDMARFKDAMNSIYNIGREVAIYQNLGNLIEYDKEDYYSMINDKIIKFKNTYVGSTMDNLSWPQEFEPSSILGDSFETQPKVIL